MTQADPRIEARERLEAWAKAAERRAEEGWKMFPSVPTSDMTEALERSESYCDSCHGTAFSGWSGYEALFKNAPSEVIALADLRTILSALSEAEGELDRMREAAFVAGWNAHETGYDSRPDGCAEAFRAYCINPDIFTAEDDEDEARAALSPTRRDGE